jgi:hypothetical protein
MPHLGAPGQFEALTVKRSFMAKFQRRLRFGDFGDLSKVLQAAVRPRNCRPAERTDKHDRRTGRKFDRSAARRTA